MINNYLLKGSVIIANEFSGTLSMYKVATLLRLEQVR